MHVFITTLPFDSMQYSTKVSAYIRQQPEADQPYYEQLRQLILESGPGVEELLKYGIPFYHYFGPLCYLSPQKGQLILGFTKGASLADENGILTGNQQVVRHFVVNKDALDQLDELRRLLQEAMLLNEFTKKKKK